MVGPLSEPPPRTSHRLLCADIRSRPPLAPGSVDLVVTSPPYPMIRMWDELFSRQSPEVGLALREGRGPEAFEGMHRLLDGAWKVSAEALREGGFLCVVVGDATRTLGGRFALYPNHLRVLQACRALGLTPLPSVLWSKPTNSPNKFLGSGMLPAGAYVTLEHEHILVFRKGTNRRFSTPADRARRRSSAIFFEERNQWFSDRWSLTGTRQRLEGLPGRLRSAAFPLEVPYRLIAMFSILSDRVLDPFAGSGTTLLAALGLGRESVGIEQDERLCRRALERLATDWGPVEDRNRRRLEEHPRWLADHPSTPALHPHALYDFHVVSREERYARILHVDRVDRESEGSVVAQYT